MKKTFASNTDYRWLVFGLLMIAFAFGCAGETVPHRLTSFLLLCAASGGYAVARSGEASVDRTDQSR